MKKWSYVGALLICIILSVESKAYAVWFKYIPREFELEDTRNPGHIIGIGEIVEISPNESVLLNIYAKDIDGDGIRDYDMLSVSGDITVGFNYTIQPNSTGSLLTFVERGWGPENLDEPYATVSVTLGEIIDGYVNFTVTYEYEDPVIGETDTSNTLVYPIRLQTVSTPNLRYLFVPKSISLVNENNKPATILNMTAGDRKTLYVMVDDANGDGYIDENDYYLNNIAVTDLLMVPSFNIDDESLLSATTTTLSLTGLTPSDYQYPRKIATVTLTARNTSPVLEDRYTDIDFQIEFGGTTAGGIDISDILPDLEDSGTIATPKVSVRVEPRDDAGGGGSDGGGSCSVLGLGALMLLVPCVVLKGKR